MGFFYELLISDIYVSTFNFHMTKSLNGKLRGNRD